MVLSGEWSQVEVIDLVNDGNGLGFILVGGRSTGVVVKALTPGGVAERDGRLQNGDHLIQIGEVNLRGYSSEQVAMVLRQAGKQVRLIVARPIDTSGTTTGDMKILSVTNRTLIISTKQLSDPEELAKFLFPQVNVTTTTTTTTAAATAVTMKTENNNNHYNKNLEQKSLSKTTGSAQPLTSLPVEHNHNIDLTNFILKSDNELADLPLPEVPQKFLDSNEISYDADLDIVPYSIISPPCIITPTSPTTVDIPLIKTDNFSKDHIKTVIARHLCAAGNQAKFSMETPKDNHKDDDDDDDDNDDNDNDDDDDQEVSPGFCHLESPETETYEVRLRKNVYGLGITVAGYVCEEEDVSGIFVKSIIEGSAAEMSGKIQANDRIIAVDGILLTGVTNHQAVEILRNTDIEVRLTLERFLRGRKFEHLQIALTGLKVDAQTHSQSAIPPSISLTTLSWLSPKLDTTTDLFADESIDDTDMTKEDEEVDRIVNNYYVKQIQTKHEIDEGKNLDEKSMKNEDENKIETPKKFQSDLSDLSPTKFQSQNELSNDNNHHLNSKATLRTPVEEENNEVSKSQSIDKTTTQHTPRTEHSQHTQQSSMSMESLKVAWKSEFPESQVIVVEINKLSGLGISLEGTVDVEYGIEKRPHHYIRSILEDGPVGKQGILKPGDELLQVNEHNLQGLNHTEVVKILKELPPHVKLVCVRGTMSPSIINTSNNPEAFETRSLLPGGHQSLQNLVTKAQSESSLYTSSTATLTDRQKSKSLENISGLALWSNEITYVEIEKLEQGFGFSILDYQDPLDPDGNVIVIRGLIHGGSAETTNQIFPGDRLVSVGEHDLQGLTLDEAVTILKGMPLGITKLGICRPFSASDSNIDSGSGENDLTSA